MEEITKEINILVDKLETLEQALRQEAAASRDEEIIRKNRGSEVVLLRKTGNLWQVMERHGGRGWSKTR